VAQRLIDEGFEPRDVEVRSTGAGEAGGADESGERGGFWSWLFGESEDRSSYSERVSGGGALLAVTTDEAGADRACRVIERAGGQTSSTAATGPRQAAATPGGDEERVVPVVEEQLRVGKRPVTRGGVRVYSRVSERPVQEEVHLRDERVHVDRRPVDRPVNDAGDLFEEVVVDMAETVEEPVIAKEARVVEEVVVGKHVEERVDDVKDRVRRTDVEVEQLGADDAASRFGTDLAGDTAIAGRSWSDVEPEARRRWESGNRGPWTRASAAIRAAWERARGQRHAA
jgi:uncharacterized protein (TIGR02271 family)